MPSKTETPLPSTVAESVAAPTWMISKPDSQLKRVTSIVLALYTLGLLSQALCVLSASHLEPGTGGGIAGHAGHTSSPASRSASSSTAAPTSAARAAHGSPQFSDAGHSGTSGERHAGQCAVVACASALTATYEEYLVLMSRGWKVPVVYRPGTMAPNTDTVPPPPRLG
jgi:hypothetical protein